MVASLCAAALLSGCRSTDSKAQVHDLAGKLTSAGLGCADFKIEDRVPAGTTASAPQASGYCTLKGGGPNSPTTIYAYADTRDLVARAQGGFPGVDIVYSDTWAVQVVPAEKGPAVRDALGGTLIPQSGPTTPAHSVLSGQLASLSSKEVCLRKDGQRCFPLSPHAHVESGLQPGDRVDIDLDREKAAVYVRSNQ
jgi:hypothetical protein